LRKSTDTCAKARILLRLLLTGLTYIFINDGDDLPNKLPPVDVPNDPVVGAEAPPNNEPPKLEP
jgi:hypothetical protein